MAGDANIWPSVVSALSGLAGVGLGGWLAYVREGAREREQRTQATSYLAILVVAHLDQFASQCAAVAYDDGTSEGRPAGKDSQYHQTTVDEPEFDPLALNVDWKALPTSLMYEVLNLPQLQIQLKQYLTGVGQYDDPPEYADYFRARQLEYARLGLRAGKLASQLRQHAGLPPYKLEVGTWDMAAELAARVEDLERRE